VQSTFLDPCVLGFPINRDRQYIVCRLRSKTMCFKTQFWGFGAMFHRDCAISWSEFCIADDDEIDVEVEQCCTRPSSLSQGLVPKVAVEKFTFVVRLACVKLKVKISAHTPQVFLNVSVCVVQVRFDKGPHHRDTNIYTQTQTNTRLIGKWPIAKL
jgi:hypothetical protein